MTRKMITTSTSSCINRITHPPYYSASLLSFLGNADILSVVVSFLPGCYRFVAIINRTFYQAYIKEFPENTTTYLDASSMKMAKFCIADYESTRRKNGWTRPHLLSEICAVATKQGNLAVLQYMLSMNCIFSILSICTCAAKFGQMDILQWARQNGCPWDEQTCTSAAENGHLEVLIWAQQNGCPWDEQACNIAAENGYLDVLIWAQRNGCPWDGCTCSKAAENGHLEVLIWAQQNGCPWDEETCSSAAENGHLDVLIWA